jgi:hypothetical protein
MPGAAQLVNYHFSCELACHSWIIITLSAFGLSLLVFCCGLYRSRDLDLQFRLWI